MNKSKLTFCHPGSFGDTIYSLSVIKLLGGGDLYIKYKSMNELAWNAFGWVNAGPHAGRYTKQDIDFLFPLLKHQSYLNKIDLWRNELVDYDLGTHYKFTTGPEGWHGNQTECYALVCGLDLDQYRHQLMIEPWLDSVEPIKFPGKPIVINRTSRYLPPGSNSVNAWKKWVSEGLDQVAVFVGTKEECDRFNETFSCNVQHVPVTDMLEMARIIQGAEQFMGNQSVALSLAIGLGKTFWCEQQKIPSKRGMGDVWFPRVNGHYF
jgi:hypothetical protein